MKKYSLILAVVLVLSMVLGACAPAATPTAAPTTAPAATDTSAPAATATTAPEPTATTAPAPTDTAAPAATATTAGKKVLACMVTDIPKVFDKSFNETTWKGIQDAQAQLGADGKYLTSNSAADYDKNIQSFIDGKCDLIIGTGFLLGDAIKKAAEANPTNNFAIVDFSYSPTIANVNGQVFQTDEAAFLAGYLAAGMSKTAKVGTFGGLPIPTVTIFMDGFVRGVNAYNTKHSTKVTVLGYDLANPKGGTFANSFSDQTKGKEIANSMMDEGADVLMPVAGPVGYGAAAAALERGNVYLIGVDSDWNLPDENATYRPIILTSVMKGMDKTILTTIKEVQDGTFKGGVTVGNLANGGVSLAPYHDLDAKIPADLKSEIEALKADISAGKVELNPDFQIKP
jgi:basic membrane protein A and related proteins